MLLKGNHIWKDFSDLNQQKYVQSENLKYQIKFEDAPKKPELRFLTQKCFNHRMSLIKKQSIFHRKPTGCIAAKLGSLTPDERLVIRSERSYPLTLIHWATPPITNVINQFQPSVGFHIETSHLKCTSNQMTGFYMKCNTWLKWVEVQVNWNLFLEMV